MSEEQIKYGIINEDYFTLRSPRAVDESHDSIASAFAEAAQMIEDGIAEEISVVRCRYSLKDDTWYELCDGGSIQVQAHNWKDEDEFRAERKARREARALVKQSIAAAKR